MSISGVVAVVTGGSQGIGRAVARRLAREGARIAVIDLRPADDTLAELESLGTPGWAAEADISDPGDVQRCFAELEQALGPAGVLVNAAGMFADEPFLETSVELWDEVMAVNSRGTFLCSQAAAIQMRDRGGGRIVNILSTAAAQGFALESAYCASKAAALLLTKVMAVELAEYDIQVNGVGPGTVDTAMGNAYLGEGPIAEHELSRTPMGRLGRPEDIAKVILHLASDDADWVTGTAYTVDGGLMAASI